MHPYQSAPQSRAFLPLSLLFAVLFTAIPHSPIQELGHQFKTRHRKKAVILSEVAHGTL
jgi:hypothetical protein